MNDDGTFHMTWKLNRTNIVCGVIGLLGIAQFAGSVVHAIGIYPGGYDIANHFLSDLGRTRTLAGADNADCACLFNWSLILLGTSLIPFFVVMSLSLDEGRAVSCVSGVLSACGLVGIGSTPYDRYILEHVASLGLWLVSTLLMVAVFLVYSRLNRIASLTLAVATLFVFGAAWKYVAADSHNGHVVFQKLLAVFAIVWFGIVFMIVSVSTIHSIASRHRTEEELARRYIRTIERGHRR